ncbi:MAG: tail fiber domain-containing protein [Anaerolineales bacterium]|nr:tail fiber domain-containing protein [Anaerolineales bacterium]
MGFFDDVGNVIKGAGKKIGGSIVEATTIDEDDRRRDEQDAQQEQRRRDAEAARTEAGIIGSQPGAQDLNFVNSQDAAYRRALDAERERNRTRSAPSARPVSVGQNAPINDRENQFRTAQMDLVAKLQAQANGQGPSLAQNQLNQATSQTLNNALALQAAQRGMGSALAGRNLLNAQSSALQQAAGQSADVRLQEQMAAQGLLANVLTQGRGQDQAVDIEQARQNQAAILAQAGFDTQLSMADLSAQLQTQAGLDQMTQFLLTQGFNQNEAERKAREFAAQLALQERQGFLNASIQGEQLAQQDENADRDFAAKLVGAGSSTVGGALAVASDMRLKTNIQKVQNGPLGVLSQNVNKLLSDKEEKKEKEEKPSIENMLKKLKAYRYEYKDGEKHGEGKQFGVMAQDLEKTPEGKSMVKETKDGKMVDVGKLANAAMASVVSMHEKQEALESKVSELVKIMKAKRKEK